ncbi:MAG TPA: permease, partial [Microbacteriaceae bacterium]|nr:permease [Microbacteriaceae bacterium]
VGPLVAVLSFVCSIGNVPLAAVLWNGGISFGGVLAFIFADLIILPILDIYRRYYGWRMAWFLLGTFYVTMAAAGLIVEFIFQGAGLIPHTRHAKIEMTSITWNYTTYLNIVFLALAAVFLWRYFQRGGGWKMLRTMNEPMEHGHGGHAGHEAHGHA